MEELSQKVRTAIEQVRKVMNDGIEILFVGMENHRLREELRKLSYYEEARRALYKYVDLNEDGEAERYVLLTALMGEDLPDGRLYTFDGELMENTGIVRKESYRGGKLIISYYKGENLIKEKIVPTPTYLTPRW